MYRDIPCHGYIYFTPLVRLIVDPPLIAVKGSALALMDTSAVLFFISAPPSIAPTQVYSRALSLQVSTGDFPHLSDTIMFFIHTS